jgi:nicotinamidase-related amidase
MNTALILIDFQNDYFKNGSMPLADSENASINARQIMEKFRADTSLVIHIQHLAIRPDATFFLPDTFGCRIHDYVKPATGEKIIVKHYPNSFLQTDLLEYLRFRAISDLVICGMMTHMCVDATTRAAKDFGFHCTLISDACATKNLEINGHLVKSTEVHNGFLAALNYHYSTVKTTEQFLKE